MMRNLQTESFQVRSAGADLKMVEARIHGRRSNNAANDSLKRKMTPVGFYSVFLVSVVMAITLSSLIQPLQANPTCILNCAQCVKIYGDFFDGHSCAKVCMESRSRFDAFVDCADPTTIARFLKSY